MDKLSAVNTVSTALGVDRKSAQMTLILNSMLSDLPPWDDRNVEETIEYGMEDEYCVPV